MRKSNPAKKRAGFYAAQILVTLCLVGMISAYFALLASAQNRYIIRDGDRTTVLTSTEADPDQVLAQAGITVNDNDIVTAVRSGNDTEITIERVCSVTVECDGQSRSASACTRI